jgi:type IV pilus assembly protein PilM
MLNSRKENAVVGLDVEAGSAAAVEVTSNGSVAVTRTGIAPLTPGVFRDGEVADPEALAESLRGLFAEHKLSKSVRLGVANHRVAVRQLRLPLIEDANELETAVRFQAQDHIPMPLEHAVLDYQVVNRVAVDGERGIDVVAVAARRDMLEALLGTLRQAGLRPVGIDLSAFGMIRALSRESNGAAAALPDPQGAPVDPAPGTGDQALAPDATTQPSGAGEIVQARLYCNLGDVTNLAVARGSTCLFTRISSFGVEGIAQRLAERRQLALDEARRWLVHAGLERPVEEIEGDRETAAAAREALNEGVSKLADELRLSLDFYGAQEGAHPIEGVVAGGPGSTIPGLVERLQGELGSPFEIGRPRALSQLEDPEAARLTLSYGLALEE